MKQNPTIHFFLALAALALFPWSGLRAQDCEAYYPMKAGAVFEMTTYDEKGKVTGISTTTIADKESSGNRTVVAATTVHSDPKGKESTTMTYDVICDNGEFRLDMRAMMSPEQMRGMEGMENVSIEIDSDELAFPRGLAVGASLPDASITMKITMQGINLPGTTVHVTNRKVTGKESRTTPAGTYDCLILEEDVNVKSMGMDIVTHSKSWYSLGVGQVRNESYNKGKLQGVTELTKFKP